ncbi:hypothetical protein SGRIM128S_03339 [Streptomyces griseomycini]
MQGQFLDGVEAAVAGGVQGEVEEAGAGEQDPVADGVVGEPGLGPRGEPAGEDDAFGVGQRHRGAQQRVVAGGESEGRRRAVARGRHRRGQPVAVVLEGVGGQVDAGAVAAEHGRQVEVDAPDVQPRGGEDRRVRLGPVGAQRRHEHGVGGVVRAHGGEGAAGSDLHHGRHALGGQARDAVGEPYRLAYVLDPVVR